MAIKVIQWAAGNIGKALLRAIIDDPAYEVVGCFVYSDEKAGRDIGELVDHGPIGVLTTQDRDEIFALDADLVFHAPLKQPDMTQNDDDVVQLLRSGKDVITTTEYIWPVAKGDDHGRRFDEACREGASTLHGTGEYPGFWVERIATTLTGLSRDIQHIRFTEYHDISNTSLNLLETIGAGRRPEEVEVDSPRAGIVGNYFIQVLRYVTDVLGLHLDRIERTIELLPAARVIPIAARTIEPGAVANIAWSWTGFVGSHPFITLQTRWYTDTEAPGWEDARHNTWECHLEGTPSARLRIEVAPSFLPDHRTGPIPPGSPLGHAIVDIVLNAVPDVLAAPPGVFRFPVGGLGQVGSSVTGSAG
jgi:hypothetical protein